jgi:hypothetical protein
MTRVRVIVSTGTWEREFGPAQAAFASVGAGGPAAPRSCP